MILWSRNGNLMALMFYWTYRWTAHVVESD